MSMRAAPGGWCWLMFIGFIAGVGSDWLDCDKLIACRCKWSSGKKTAECPSSDLHRPPHLSSDIQVLDLHDNPLRVLQNDAFASVGLLNLQKINLRATRLQNIYSDAFRELRILVELDLSDNEITSLPKHIFRGNERLRLVILTNNLLSALIEDQFPPLPHLRLLLLDGCKLRSIHPGALRNLKSLETVDIRRNQLTTLALSTFSLPALKTLTLSGNPWRCDCRLREFRDWFLESKLGTEDLTCVEPATYSGTSWRNVLGQQMVCSPEVKSSTLVVRAEAGSEVTFGCWVHGVPQPIVTWYFDGVDLFNSSFDGNIHETQSETESNGDDILSGSARWVNLTITNVTVAAAGEWTCVARSSAGEAKSIISLVLPRLQTATARTAPGIPHLLGVVFGALGLLATAGCIAAFACWQFRRRRVPESRSFTDQEKRLLDASIVVSCDRSVADINSPCDFELTERSLSLTDEPPRGCAFDPVHITIEGTPGGFPPPPAEFAVPVPYGNIFISVQVAHSGDTPKYPDLLGGGSTLPRRNRSYCPAPAYDNMGPRITAAGSSTWSLPGAGVDLPSTSAATGQLLVAPTPPPEFVSL